MLRHSLLILLLVACCGCEPKASPSAPSSPSAATPAPPVALPSVPRAPASVPVAAPAALPKDLRTRQTGDDWPTFLGPTGDSKSSEKGILTQWPKAGPRIVWQRK